MEMEIQEHARDGIPDPEAPDIPDIQEPEDLGPQERRFWVYTGTRIFCILFILTNFSLDWAVYAKLGDCRKTHFLVVTIIGNCLSLIQIGNIIYQIKSNLLPVYRYEEPLNYIDGRTEVLYQLLLAEIPQMFILRLNDKECVTSEEKCPIRLPSAKIPPEVALRMACVIVGVLSCWFRFNFSRPLSTMRRRRVKNEFDVLKLDKSTLLVKGIIFFDQQLPRILKIFSLGFLCFWRKCKIPLGIGYCICDHLTPIWRWMYFVLECWVCRFTFCPKKERGEVWLVNRIRALRRRPGFLCFNKEDPYWLGDYSMYVLGLGITSAMMYLGQYECRFPTKSLGKVYDMIGAQI